MFSNVVQPKIFIYEIMISKHRILEQIYKLSPGSIILFFLVINILNQSKNLNKFFHCNKFKVKIDQFMDSNLEEKFY